MRNGSIGIFDSGSGGLTILHKLINHLPQYKYVYLGDHAHAPYGNKSFDEIYDHTLRCVEYLGTKNCPLIIIACNTSSAKALRNIQQLWLPQQKQISRVLGIIIPTAEEVVSISHSKRVGILATQATISSQTFEIEIKKLNPNIKVYQQACPTWVDIVEHPSQYTEAEINKEIEKYIVQLFQQSNDIDTLILGCTHYPLLWQYIEKFIPKQIRVIEQGSTVAKKLAQYLMRHPEIESTLEHQPHIQFLTTSDPIAFEKKSQDLFGSKIKATTVKI